MPHKHNGKMVPGDPRFGTRWATAEERELAHYALRDLDEHRLKIVLVPAPVPSFEGHRVRTIESKNPDWYSHFGKLYWKGLRSFQLKRSRVRRAMIRVKLLGIVRRNGYEVDLLEHLRKWKGAWLHV